MVIGRLVGTHFPCRANTVVTNINPCQAPVRLGHLNYESIGQGQARHGKDNKTILQSGSAKKSYAHTKGVTPY